MEDVDAVFKAISDPTRRILVEELAERDGQTLFELCVRLISRHGLDVSRQAVAKHLDVLEGAGSRRACAAKGATASTPSTAHPFVRRRTSGSGRSCTPDDPIKE